MSAYKLSADVVVRVESFGGVLFHSRTGATIELDREAFESLVVGTHALPMVDGSAASTSG